MDALIYRRWLFSYSYILKIRGNFLEAGMETNSLDGSDQRSKQYHIIYWILGRLRYWMWDVMDDTYIYMCTFVWKIFTYIFRRSSSTMGMDGIWIWLQYLCAHVVKWTYAEKSSKYSDFWFIRYALFISCIHVHLLTHIDLIHMISHLVNLFVRFFKKNIHLIWRLNIKQYSSPQYTTTEFAPLNKHPINNKTIT